MQERHAIQKRELAACDVTDPDAERVNVVSFTLVWVSPSFLDTFYLAVAPSQQKDFVAESGARGCNGFATNSDESDFLSFFSLN